MPQRLGIFGGSFDPIHYGHLLLAETCREHLQLDQVWLVPAAVPPHKQSRQLSSDKQRIEMIRLAVGGHPSTIVSTLEIDRGGVSYTADTLHTIRRDLPTTDLFVLMGADTLVDLPNWHRPREICEMAIPVAVRRRGSPPPDLATLRNLVSDERLNQIRVNQVDMPLIELASTDIRRRVAGGQSIRYRTPRAVEKYIESQGLYRPANPSRVASRQP